MKDGFLRTACATPQIKVADCSFNAQQIITMAETAVNNGASLVVFPELCITGYTCSDLFLQKTLLLSAEKALGEIAEKTASLDALILVGLPVKKGAALYNCAAVLSKGKILGLVPKRNIPNYSEFYELRHFTACCEKIETTICGQNTEINPNVIFACRTMPEFKLGIEICEDVWTPEPPSGKLALAGATVIANLSASDEVIGKADYRRMLIKSQSARLISAYLYTSAGMGESTTDMVFSGHNIICENGSMLAESKRFTTGITYADIDLQKMESERLRSNTYVGNNNLPFVEFDIDIKELKLNRKISKTPFVPQSKINLDERCEEILTIQATGLATRLNHTHAKTAVIGLSGGLDSTLALIVAVHAFDMLGLDRKNIIAVTMPCFGTTKRTKSNAEILAESYGVSFKDIDISKAVTQHFEDIGQDINTLDVTFENGQARERTQVLMDIANKTGGFVIGTGDLSELALGWATYNGDHMSMYAVNASIPKTLVRHLTAFEAEHSEGKLKEVLLDILATPVSPELLPPKKDGEISQKTEDLVGPYELHDFYLYYFVRLGFTPSKIFRLAKIAFDGEYDDATIEKWLKTFIRRFFAQQFKRSCLPDGPKVGTVTLSPRGDWRMPSDASAYEWLEGV
ncbi:MAG: NAD(+) synthase [Acutalibacteraceae bacterium]